MRKPIPLRCVQCDEIIYDDQPYDEYGWDWDSSPMPCHTSCWKESELKKREEQIKYLEKIKELSKMPRDSLSYNDLLALHSYEMHQSFVDFITQPTEGFNESSWKSNSSKED